MTADLPTVRATIREHVRSARIYRLTIDEEIDAILAELSDPAVQDELARWLRIEPFEHDGDLLYVNRSSHRPYYAGTTAKPADEREWEPVYRLRQHTRSEP